MSIFFQDPNETRLPPEEVRLIEVRVTPQLNGGRVKIHLELTPFVKRPNINVTIANAFGEELAHTSILEAILPKMEFTMHLRKAERGGEYSVEICAYYQRMLEPSETPVDIPLPEPMIVDIHKTTFILPISED